MTRPPLAGRAVVHAQAEPPWPRGRALCDRMGDRMRVPATAPDGRVLIRAALNLMEAPGREVDCGRCLRALTAQEARPRTGRQTRREEEPRPPPNGGANAASREPHPARSRTVKPIPLADYLADPRPDVALWGTPEGESLHAQDIDEAIDAILADYPEDDPPPTIEVAGLRRMTVPASDWSADRILDLVLTPVDEEYGDPESPMDDRITPAMRTAAETFGEVLRREYVPWSCEEVVRIEVDVAAWLAANPASNL